MAVEGSVGDRLQPVSDSVSNELDRRLASVRAAMAEHALDGLVVSGSEYSGFEGAVTYLSGFQIVHRYAYVVVPAEGDPFVVFPAEARYVGEHGMAQVEQRSLEDVLTDHMAETAGRLLRARHELRLDGERMAEVDAYLADRFTEAG